MSKEQVDIDFLPIFLDEAIETLERWEAACLKLEVSASQDVLDELFRAAHNIKGSSKSVGLIAFGGLVHKAEDVITKLRTNALACSPDVIAVLLETQKTLFDWSQALKNDPYSGVEVDSVVAKLTQYLEQGRELDQCKKSANDDFIDFSTESSAKDTAKAEPTDQRALEEKSSKKELDLQKSPGHKSDETVRVSLRKLDSVIRLIGELSIQYAIIKNAKENNKLHESSSQEAISLSHKVIQDLQSEAMALRMQPLENLFQRMERVCRDVARQQDKSIHVELRGLDVELDKTVIEKMKDPLVHILRNAVDHGIEDKESRLRAGKVPTARILIEGIQTAANVTIRIKDDGRGLNEERILKKAVEKGLVSPSASLSNAQIHNLIFQPGFSTADKVTDVSGRGVGMDVVKRAVDDLGGAINIQSVIGQGTEFNINLPSTLSILDAIIVELNHAQYAVPVQDIDEVVDLSAVQVQSENVSGRMMNLRGRVMPIERMRDYLPTLDVESQGDANGVAIITRHLETTVAFEVDRILGQQSIVVRQLDEKLAKVPGFSGATILASGEPSMIIHLPHIVKSYQKSAQSIAV